MSVPGPTAGVVISVPTQGEAFPPSANIPVMGIASAQGGADGPPVFEGATIQLDNGTVQQIPASDLTIQIQKYPPHWMFVQFSYEITPQPTGPHTVTVAATFSNGRSATFKGGASFSVGQGGSKPYAVLFDEFFDSAGVSSAVIGGIWVPPPADGTNRGTLTFAGTVTGKNQQATLTFPTLDGPPATASAMRISEPSIGDLYRLAVAPPPANPAHLNGFAIAGPPLTQDEINNLTANFGSQTFPVDWTVQAACAALTLGLYIPNSITVSAIALTLVPATGTLTATLTGTVTVSHWWWTSTNPFTFTETVALAASGDPVDPSRILAATETNANITIIGGSIITIFGLLAGNMAGKVTPILEDRFNQAIPTKVAEVLSESNPPQQLAPQAVISARQITINDAGLTLTPSIANIFGPATIPVPPRIAVVISLLAATGTRRTIQMTVTDPATNRPIAGATVTVTDNNSGIVKASGATDQNGNITLTYTWCSEPSNGGPRIEDSCLATVSKPGYSDFDTLTPTATSH